MQDRLEDLGDAVVVLVTFTRPRNLRGYRGRLGLPYPVLADEARAAYRAFGLGRGPWWRVWGPATWWRYVRALAAGERVERPTEDTLQLGGDVVVGRDGRVSYLYRSRAPTDRPPLDELVAAVREA